MKECSRCHTKKQRSEFYRRRDSADGLNAWCKPCHISWAKEDRERRPEFHAERYREQHQKNRESNNAASRLYYSRNRQKAIAYAMQWQKGNRERAKELLRQASHRLWLNVLHRLGDRCKCCGETLLTMLHVDHIHNDGNRHRKMVGGQRQVYREILQMDDPTGLFQILCANCNMSKARNKGICEHITRMALVAETVLCA